MNKSTVSSALFAVFFVAFGMLLYSLNAVCALAMLISLVGYFGNEWLDVKNRYEVRLKEMDDRLNSHILEHNMNAM